MEMLLSIKTKLKLNKVQKLLMAKHAEIARFTYNWGLATWKELYSSGRNDSFTIDAGGKPIPVAESP
jgi:transposase